MPPQPDRGGPFPGADQLAALHHFAAGDYVSARDDLQIAMAPLPVPHGVERLPVLTLECALSGLDVVT
jgi:hypothetical protein